MPEREYRRKIDELVALYELEPDVRDVYVEGPTDRQLLRRALSAVADAGSVQVYEIETVDVPDELLIGRLAAGNKGRVVALGCELETRCSRELINRVVCVADQDLDELLGSSVPCGLVVYTSGLSLDALILSKEVVGKLFGVVLLSDVDPDDLLSQLLGPLNRRVAQRAAAFELRFNTEAPDLTRVVEFKGGRLTVALEQFQTRLLDKERARDRTSEFERAVAKYEASTCGRPDHFTHVEDVVDLLYVCGRSVNPRAMPGRDAFRRFLVGLIEDRQLARLPETQEVVKRLGLLLPSAT